ncbi:MAG: hypothetical protein CVU17_09555 [Betaproteobacteria bacterium HGW-Betaproteobacteria-11]|nr:MAG: hypothetical protein CVU17_09555 [Betaproteobacteria bacterium HGW-Betaproteobacteria-11]
MDYVFFDAALCDEFIAYAASLNIACRCAVDENMDATVAVRTVTTADDLPGALLALLEARCDELLDETASRVASAEGWVGKRLAAVSATLADGSVRTIRLDPELANKLLATFSTEEIHRLVSEIAAGLAAPEEPRLCREPATKD